MTEELGRPLDGALVRPDTICGSEYSSVKALPSAMRSGQKATSTGAKVGDEILHQARSLPGRPCCAGRGAGRREGGGRGRRSASGTACGIWVQVLVDRGTDHDDDVFRIRDDRGVRSGAKAVVAEGTSESASHRPAPRRGARRTTPGRRRSGFVSNAQTRRPALAKAIPSGSPTCPQPPTRTTSKGQCTSAETSGPSRGSPDSPGSARRSG